MPYPIIDSVYFDRMMTPIITNKLPKAALNVKLSFSISIPSIKLTIGCKVLTIPTFNPIKHMTNDIVFSIYVYCKIKNSLNFLIFKDNSNHFLKLFIPSTIISYFGNQMDF